MRDLPRFHPNMTPSWNQQMVSRASFFAQTTQEDEFGQRLPYFIPRDDLQDIPCAFSRERGKEDKRRTGFTEVTLNTLVMEGYYPQITHEMQVQVDGGPMLDILSLQNDSFSALTFVKVQVP